MGSKGPYSLPGEILIPGLNRPVQSQAVNWATAGLLADPCCSARSGTAMDLGLDYCRVLLALGFVSSRFCTPKSAWPVGVIGVSRQAFSGFYKTRRADAHV